MRQTRQAVAQGRLQILGVMGDAAIHDPVVGPPDDAQPPMRHPPKIAAAQPMPAVAPDKGPGRRLGIAVIAARHRRPRQPDLAAFARRQFGAGPGIGDPQGRGRAGRKADHAAMAAGKAAAGGEYRGLGHAVTGQETVSPHPVAGQFRHRPAKRSGMHRLGPDMGDPQCAKIQPGHAAPGQGLRQQVPGKGRRAGIGDPQRGDRAQPVQRIAREPFGRGQHRRSAGKDRLDQMAEQPHVVMQRQPTKRPRRGTAVKGRHDIGHIGQDIGMAQHDAARLPGRTGGVLQAGGRLGPGWRRRPGLRAGAVEPFAQGQQTDRRAIRQTGGDQPVAAIRCGADQRPAVLGRQLQGPLRGRHMPPRAGPGRGQDRWPQSGQNRAQKCRDQRRAGRQRQQHRAALRPRRGQHRRSRAGPIPKRAI